MHKGGVGRQGRTLRATGKAEKQPPWVIACRKVQQAEALMLMLNFQMGTVAWAAPVPGPPQLAGRGPSCAHAPAAQVLWQAQTPRASSHAAMPAMPARETCTASGRPSPKKMVSTCNQSSAADSVISQHLTDNVNGGHLQRSCRSLCSPAWSWLPLRGTLRAFP